MKNFLLSLILLASIGFAAEVTLDPADSLNLGPSTWKQTEWNSDGNAEGWTANGTSATISGGVLSGTTSSITPQLTLTGITDGPDLDLAFNDHLEFRLKLPASFSGDIQVHYGAANTGTAASKTGFASDRIITIPNANIAKDGAFHVYRVDTSLEPWWRGTLSDLRLQIGAASGVAFELDSLRVGDAGTVPTILYLDADCNRTVVARNFVFGWSDAPGAMGESLTDARVRSNLRDAEECYAFYRKVLKYPMPRSLEAGAPYKINFVSMEGGYHAGTDGVRMNIDPTGLTTDPNPPSWVIPHEMAHIFQGILGPNVPGEYCELHANYSRERWIKFMSHHYPGATNFEPAMMADMHLNLPTGRNYYLTWPFYLYLDTNPDNLEGLGDGTVASAWQNMQSGETMHDSLARTKTAFSVKDLIGNYARRGLTYDYPGYKETINAKTGGILKWEQLTEPIRRPDDSAWWRVPPQRAPMQTGFTLTELVPSGTGAGRVVTVELKGLLGQNGEDWRASLVIINDSGTERYTPLFGNNGTGSVTLASDENRVYLAVAATPADYEMYDFDEASHPFRSDPAKRRFHYEFKLTGATPKERDNGATTGLVQHANGGGYKASTATVDATAYIGPNARVLGSAQVLGNARVEDYAVVQDSAKLQDSAIARGHAEVSSNAVMTGSAIVADFSRLSGSATLSGSARMLEHSNLSGGVATDQSTLKGCAGSWDGTLSGNAIADGDYSHGRDIHNASVFGHKPWDSIPDSWLNPMPTGIFACYEFNAATDGILRDTYAATDALQRGNPSWIATDGGRNGILTLNGTNQWVQLERSVAEFPTMTVTAWVKWNGGTADQALFQIGDGGSKFIQFTPSNASGVAELKASDGSNTYGITAASALPVGVWTQVAISLDGTFGKLTVNGGTIASGSLPLRPDQILPPNVAASPAHNFIGRTTNGNFFSGAIDDFKVYSAAIPTFTQVSIATLEPSVPENAPGATIRVTRESLTGSSTSGDLTVNYTVAGTAISGDDFVPLSGSVVISDGQSYADITLVPVHDGFPEGDETVIISLAASNDYSNSGGGSAKVTITNIGDLSSALLAWYKFNENTGTTAADSSGNGKDATLVNDPVWTPALQALSFDDANDNNDFVQTPVPNGGTRTLAAWFRPESSVGIQNIWNFNAVFDSDVGGQYGAGWGVVNSTIRVMLDDQMWDTGVAVTLNQWQHGTLTFDNTRVRFYLNGELAASSTYGQGGITTANYTIGSKAFDGQIRDAKIYDRVVYASEAMEIFMANAPTLAPRDLVAIAGQGQVTLGWQTSNSGETSYALRRATVNGGPYTTIASGIIGTSFLDLGLTNGTTYYYVVAASSNGGTGPDSNHASAMPSEGNSIPPPWQQTNVGTAAGSPTSTFNNGQIAVKGAGERITSGVKTDSFRFVSIPIIGNCTLTAKVEAIGSTNTAAKAGVMIRETLANNSRHASTMISTATSNNRSFIRRATANNNSSATSATRTDFWVRIVRSGTSFSSFTSADGVNWTQLGTNQTVSMSTTAVVYAGLAVCSGSTTTLSNAVFSNVSITGGYPTGIAATAGNARVDLCWASVPGATSYRVKRATTSGGAYVTLSPNPTSNSFTDTGLTNGMRYFYVVSAHNGTAESANSSEVFATPSAPQAGIPENLAATDAVSQVDLTWTSATNAAGYRVKRATSPTGTFSTIGSPVGTSFSDTTVDATTNYFYTVVAVNSDGEESPASSVVEITRCLYFDANGSTAGSVIDGGSFSWLTSSWATAPGGTFATGNWQSGKQVIFFATSPAAPFSYNIDLANYHTGTHGNFTGIRALAGTVNFTGNVSDFYLTTPVTITASPGAAIVFQQTRSGSDVLAFNLNGQPATFYGDITVNSAGLGNSGSVIVGSGNLKLGNAIANYSPASTVLEAGTTLTNTGDAGKSFNLGALTLNGATLEAINAGSTSFGNYTFSSSLTVDGTAASLISADIRCGNNTTHLLNIGETGEEVDLLISGKLGHYNWYSWAYANKTGPGTLKLTGINNLGGLTVSEGTLILEGALAIAGMDVNSLTNNAAVILATPTDTVTYPRALLGSGQYTKTGTGTLELTSTSVHSGNFHVQEGTLRMTQPSLGNTSVITVDSGAHIALAFTGIDTIGGLVLNGTPLTPGIYNADSHPAYFTGTGRLKVAASVSLAWNNSTDTGIWNASDANWTGQSWQNLADAVISHSNTPQTITLSGGLNAADVFIGNASNNANYTLLGSSGTSLNATLLTVQGNTGNGPGVGTTTLTDLSANFTSDLGVGRWDLVISGNSAIQIGGQLRSTSTGAGSGDWGRVTLQDSANVTANGGVNGAGSAWGLTLNGGSLTTPSIRAAENTYGAGARLTLNGTEIFASQNNTSFLTVDGTSQAYVGSNGARFNTNGNDISVGVKLVDVSGQAGTLTKLGDGTLTLTNVANSFTGGTTVNQGTLTIDVQGNQTQSALGVNKAVTVNSGATLRLAKTDGLGYYGANPSSLTLGGVMTIATGKHASVGSFGLTFDGGTLTSEGAGDSEGNFIFDGTITTLANANRAVISAQKIKLRNGNGVANQSVTFNVADGAAATDLLVNSELANGNGTNGLLKTGPGTLVLSGANTYTGSTTVNAGTLVADTASMLGTGNLTVADNAVCDLRNTGSTGALANAASVYLNGTGKLVIAADVVEFVARLYVNDTLLPVATYTAATHPTLISGTGSLVVTAGPPVAPSALTAAVASASSINLSWADHATNEEGYLVERSTTSVSGFSQIASLPTGTTAYSDSGLTANTTYFYRVRATNSTFGNSTYSGEASALTLFAAPTGLTATAGDAKVDLSWAVVSGATSYQVKSATVSGGPYTTIATLDVTSHTDTTTANGTTYYYVVTAVNASGESANSAEASARPLPPAGNGIWTSQSNGNWSLADNWQDYIIASGSDKTATFSQSSAVTATLDSDRSLGGLIFASGNHAIAGTSTLTLDVSTGAPGIVVGDGISATIGVPLAGNDGLTKSGNGSLVLTAASGITGATNISAGTLVYQNSYASSSHAIAAGSILELSVASGSRDSAATTFSGAGTLRKSGAGEIFWGAGSAIFALESGSLIDVQTGTFKAGSSGNEVWTNNKSNLNVASEASFDTVEANVRLNQLTGNGIIKTGYNGSNYQNLTIGVDHGSSTFSGSIQNSATTGNLVKEGTGTITLAGANSYTGTTTINVGTLNVTGSIASGGTITIADYVGGKASMDVSGMIAGSNALMMGSGSNSVGAMRQTAGSMTRNFLALGVTPGSYGAASISGGSLALSGDMNIASWGSGYQTNGGSGLLEISSGTVTVGGWLCMNRWGATQDAVLHVSGGSLTYGGNGLVANWNNDGSDTSVITVSGTGSIATSNHKPINLSNYASTANTGILNLNGGTVTPSALIGGRGFVNFNGGTLKPSADSTNFLAVNTACVHGNGASIDTDGKTITIGQSLLAPTDSGVTAIAVTDGGSGYTCPPIVKITGGTYSVPATAVAVTADSGGGNFHVASIIITSPGIYTVAPTGVSLIGGGATTSATFGDITTAANVSGALTKSGTGTLTLSAVNTYTGGTNVNAGTLVADTAGTLGTGNLTVADGAVCSLRNLNGSVADVSEVHLTGIGTLDLATGVNETVSKLYIDGILQLAGTYTASNLPLRISGNGSLIVTDGATPVLTPAETWRQANFGSTEATGDAADLADPDGDGHSNLLERAFGTNPLAHNPSGTTIVETSSPNFAFSYQQSRSASDLTIVVEVSSNLATDSWQAASEADGTITLSNDSNPALQTFLFSATTSNSHKFYRLRVR